MFSEHATTLVSDTKDTKENPHCLTT
jgi:hypothetical protein